jgi:hypothetical protein
MFNNKYYNIEFYTNPLFSSPAQAKAQWGEEAIRRKNYSKFLQWQQAFHYQET